MTQMTIGEALAQEGMDAAVNAADLDWVREAQRCLDYLIADRSNGEPVPFTSEQILLMLEWWAPAVQTREPRALGGIIRAASREGRIRATGEYRKSIRPQSHARPQMVWVAA